MCQCSNNWGTRMLLEDFRLNLLDSMLALVWSQWTTLGVSGNTPPSDKWILDPEALVLFTCSIGRYEARVFDSMLEWLRIHERLLNVQRLKTIAKKCEFTSNGLLPVIAHVFMKPTSSSKWQRLSERLHKQQLNSEPLFFLKDGSPHPDAGDIDESFQNGGYRRGRMKFRGTARHFNSDLSGNLIMKLRALLGVNSRCETIAYLLTHDEANPSEIAEATCYYSKTIYNTLSEMLLSGKLQRRDEGRESLYSTIGNSWEAFFWTGNQTAEWMNWPMVYWALDSIWHRLDNPVLLKADPLLVASELKLAVLDVLPHLQQAIPGFASRAVSSLRGIDLEMEKYSEFIENLLDYLS